MQTFIRFAGIVNVAIWLGGCVFLMLAAGPAFFSAEMLSFLPRPYAGRAAQVVLERFCAVQQWCGALALAHLLAEFLHSGRQVERSVLALLSGLFALGLAMSHLLLPWMNELHRTLYAPGSTAAQQAAARSSFGLLHGLSQTATLFIILGLLYYLWSLTRSPGWARFAPSKFRY